MQHEPGTSYLLSPGREKAVLLALLVLTGLLYLPGLNGPFLHDDFGRILNNELVEAKKLDIPSLLRSTLEYPQRPLSMMTFAANHATCGAKPACFKAVNVLLHLGTGLALWLFLKQFLSVTTRRTQLVLPAWIPLVATGFWLLHPLNTSTVLYAVQRMTILATFFSLVAMIGWLNARFLAQTNGKRLLWLILASLAMTLAVLSKESGWLVIAFIVLIELAVLPDSVRGRIKQPHLLGWFLGGLGVLCIFLLAVFPPDFISRSYISRDYTAPERLLTETRILAYYVSEILWPDPRRMSIYLDIFAPSHSLMTPASTLAAVIGCVVAICGSLAILLARPSLLAFGMLFFFIGHAMESSVIGLILAYEHRNYMASIGLLLMCAGLPLLINRHAQTAFATAALLGLTFTLAMRVETWSTEKDFISHLSEPRWATSYSANINIATYAGRMEARHQDDPLISGLYRKMARKHMLMAADTTTQPFVPLANLLISPAPAHEIQDYWDRLDQAARDNAINLDGLNATTWLASCLLASNCPISRDRFAQYLDLMLANPRKSSHVRWQLQRVGGSFFTRSYGQPEKGLALARQAAASGDVSARESLIKNLGFAGETEEALAEYARLRSQLSLPPSQMQRIEAAIANPGVALP